MRECVWKSPICLPYQGRNSYFAYASLYLERLYHAFPPLCDRKHGETNHSSSHFSSQKEKRSRETKIKLRELWDLRFKKKYYHCEITLVWGLSLLLVLFKLHKVVPSCLFFSDGDSYGSNKNICCFLRVFAWIRAGLAERESECSVAAFLSHACVSTSTHTTTHSRQQQRWGRELLTPLHKHRSPGSSGVEVFHVLSGQKRFIEQSGWKIVILKREKDHPVATVGFGIWPIDLSFTFDLALNSLNFCSTYVFYSVSFQFLLFKLFELYLVSTCNSIADSLLEKEAAFIPT